MSIPNKNNFCGGNFEDWIEVLLIKDCNGRCSWCVEKDGFHPDHVASKEKIVSSILSTDRKNVVLLGGEPTLYKDIKYIIEELDKNDRNVYITTNGSKLTSKYVLKNFKKLKGLNISLHDYNFSKNEKITGIKLYYASLICVIHTAKKLGIHIRFNCNLIKGHIDNEESINNYVKMAVECKVDSVRFAELKNEENNFINLYSIYGDKWGINNDPFTLGCNLEGKIYDIPVSFRLMCGLQTTKRIAPIDPQQEQKKVVYYDGNIYNGWQQISTKNDIENYLENQLVTAVGREIGNYHDKKAIKICKEIIKLNKEDTMEISIDEVLEAFNKGILSKEKANIIIEAIYVLSINKAKKDMEVMVKDKENYSSGGCQY